MKHKILVDFIIKKRITQTKLERLNIYGYQENITYQLMDFAVPLYENERKVKKKPK